MTRGQFLVIDGTDGSGKTTQVQLLVERLRAVGRQVREISFPRYGHPACREVEAYLRGDYGRADEVDPRLASSFYAADRLDAQKDINDWLDQGFDVIANRYVSANMGHQGGKIHDPEERRRFIQWEDDYEYRELGLRRPDLTIILHLPAEVGQRRANARDAAAQGAGFKDIHQADLHHLRDAEAAYLEIARLPGHLLIEAMEDGRELSATELHERIWAVVNRRSPPLP